MTSFSLNDLAHECAYASNGVTHEGARLLLKRFSSEQPKLYKETYEKVALAAMRDWAQNEIDKARVRSRNAAKYAQVPTRHELRGRQAPHHQAVGRSGITAVARTWYDVMFAGFILGDATRPLLKERSSQLLATGRTTTAQGTFLQALAKRLTDDTTRVRDGIKLSILQRDARQLRRYSVILHLGECHG